jgi:CHAT domain-containing protein
MFHTLNTGSLKKVIGTIRFFLEKISCTYLSRVFVLMFFACASTLIVHGQNYILNEDFNDNHNGWTILKNDKLYITDIKGGKYEISNNVISEDLMFIQTLDIHLNDLPYYSIETKITVLKTSNGGYFGLIFGGADINQFLSATLFQEGTKPLLFIKDVNDNSYSAFEESIPRQKTYTIKILKAGALFYMFIDNKPVAIERLNEFGEKVGFMVGSSTKISVDYLSVSVEDSLSCVREISKYNSPCFKNALCEQKILNFSYSSQHLYSNNNNVLNTIDQCYQCIADFDTLCRNPNAFDNLKRIYSQIDMSYFNLKIYDSCLVYIEKKEKLADTRNFEDQLHLCERYSTVYRQLGDYNRASKYLTKAISLYDSVMLNGKKIDSADLLFTYWALIASEKDRYRGKLGYQTFLLIKKAKFFAQQLNNTRAKCISRDLYLLEFDIHFNSSNMKAASYCLKKAQELSSGCDSFGILLYNIKYYTKVFDYSKAIAANQRWQQYLLNTNQSARSPINMLMVNLRLKNTIQAQNSFNEILAELRYDYRLLKNYDRILREKFIYKSSGNVRELKDYLFQNRFYQGNDQKLFDLSYMFKGLGNNVLNRNWAIFDTVSHTKISGLKSSMINNEVFIDQLYLANYVWDSIYNFYGFGLGVDPDSSNLFPVVFDITNYSHAYYSDLQIYDTIISVNGSSTKGYNSYNLVSLLRSTPIDSFANLSVIHAGSNEPTQILLKRDSIYLLDYLPRPACFYSIIDKRNVVSYLTKEIDSQEEINLDKVSQSGGFLSYYNNALSKSYLDYIITGKNTEYLYNNCIRPLDSVIARYNRVLLSLDGPFHKINYETLPYKDKEGKVTYLGDKKEIQLVSSARSLANKSSYTSNNNSIALFGFPNYKLSDTQHETVAANIVVDSTYQAYTRGSVSNTGGYKFYDLPATKYEIETIARQLSTKGWQTETYTGDNALEEQLKSLRSPRILHIATHGFFAEDIKPEQGNFMGTSYNEILANPLLRCGLALAGAETTRTDTTGKKNDKYDDGILTAEEVQYLHLDSTELVVLSACETGLGEIVNGEGVYGLQRAFLAAGAKSVLMSLWKVDDKATMYLMQNFYKHWLDEGMTKHAALWQAKLDLRNNAMHPEWAKPFYWGAFVLIGE